MNETTVIINAQITVIIPKVNELEINDKCMKDVAQVIQNELGVDDVVVTDMKQFIMDKKPDFTEHTGDPDFN